MGIKNNMINRKNTGNSFFKGTAGALLLMVAAQCIIIGINTGSVSEIFPRLLQAWLNILRNNTYTGVIALGMCMVIVSGGIDLSVGSMTCAIGAVLMYLLDGTVGLLAAWGITGAPAYIIAIAASLLLGFLLGALNGVLIGYGRIPPFVATLGTMKIFRSVTQQLTMQFNPVVPSGYKQIASAKIGNQVLLPIVYWVAVTVIMSIILKKTSFGRKVVAVGSNEKAAEYSGINIKSVKCMGYAVCGLMCGIAAVVYVARIGSMDFANAGSGYEMEAIAAAVVGGTSMSGGRGSIAGAFLGMLVVGAINNVLNMMGAPTFLCDAVRGLIIIVAVLVQNPDRGSIGKLFLPKKKSQN